MKKILIILLITLSIFVNGTFAQKLGGGKVVTDQAPFDPNKALSYKAANFGVNWNYNNYVGIGTNYFDGVCVPGGVRTFSPKQSDSGNNIVLGMQLIKSNGDFIYYNDVQSGKKTFLTEKIEDYAVANIYGKTWVFGGKGENGVDEYARGFDLSNGGFNSSVGNNIKFSSDMAAVGMKAITNNYNKIYLIGGFKADGITRVREIYEFNGNSFSPTNVNLPLTLPSNNTLDYDYSKLQAVAMGDDIYILLGVDVYKWTPGNPFPTNPFTTVNGGNSFNKLLTKTKVAQGIKKFGGQPKYQTVLHFINTLSSNNSMLYAYGKWNNNSPISITSQTKAFSCDDATYLVNDSNVTKILPNQ